MAVDGLAVTAASAEGVSAREGAQRGEGAAGASARHFMYVVECADGTLYTGYTTCVESRVAAHNAGQGAKYTKPRRPVRLVASAEFPTKHDAMSAEYRFKRLTRAEKLTRIACGTLQ